METNGQKKPEGKDLIVYIDQQLVARSDRMGALLEGTGISVEKFRYQATQQLIRKPDLMPVVQQNPGSFIACVMEAAEQGLDFAVPNEAHLVPIPGNPDKGRLPSINVFRGYKGWAKLARRNPKIVEVDAHPIYERDTYEREMGSRPFLTHKPPKFGEERGKIVGFYAIAFKENDFPVWVEMTTAQVEKHARRFIKARNGPFTEVKDKGREAENFEAYGLKTVTIRLCGRKLDLGSQFAEAMRKEMEAEGIDPDQPDQVLDAEIVEAPTVEEKLAARKAELKAQAKNGEVSLAESAAEAQRIAASVHYQDARLLSEEPPPPSDSDIPTFFS